MTKQPTALWLADEMDKECADLWDKDAIQDELRRLHSLNAELLESLKNLYTATYHLGACPGTVEEARAAIAKAEGETK